MFCFHFHFRRSLLNAVAVAIALIAAGAPRADDAAHDEQEATVSLLGAPVSAAALSLIRGGFETHDGLYFVFSFDSVTRVNGEVLTRTHVPTQVLTLYGNSTNGSSATLSSQGADSSLQAAQLIPNLSPILVQNSLDDQVLERLNTLNLQVYGIRQLSGQSVQSRILPAIISSLPH